jgi:hypothetical protein
MSFLRIQFIGTGGACWLYSGNFISPAVDGLNGNSLLCSLECFTGGACGVRRCCASAVTGRFDAAGTPLATGGGIDVVGCGGYAGLGSVLTGGDGSIPARGGAGLPPFRPPVGGGL